VLPGIHCADFRCVKKTPGKGLFLRRRRKYRAGSGHGKINTQTLITRQSLRFFRTLRRSGLQGTPVSYVSVAAFRKAWAHRTY